MTSGRDGGPAAGRPGGQRPPAGHRPAAGQRPPASQRPAADHIPRADRTAAPPGRTEPPAGPSALRPRFTSRAALLVIVICAVGLSLAYPIREYIAERRQIDQLELQNSQLAARVANLRDRERAVTSPAFIERMARDRLNMCFPSQTCYVVIPPAKPHGSAARGNSGPATPWYGALWASVRKADRTAAKPSR